MSNFILSGLGSAIFAHGLVMGVLIGLDRSDAPWWWPYVAIVLGRLLRHTSTHIREGDQNA